MSQAEPLSATEALDRMFAVIREEASKNPVFARRLLDAAGVTVAFQGKEAIAALDPVVLAQRTDQIAFRESLMALPEADLKNMLTNFGLATKEEIKRVSTRPKKIGYVELIWQGARLKAGKST